MSESLFNIFGDHITRQVMKNAARQPLENIENMTVKSTGLIKPGKLNEMPKKAGDKKKSFMSNKGVNLQSTPMKALTPKNTNFASVKKIISSDVIYNDVDKDCFFEELEFTKPTYKYDNFQDIFNLYQVVESKATEQCPSTPPPQIQIMSSSFDCSYGDDYFTDESLIEVPYEEDNLPALY